MAEILSIIANISFIIAAIAFIVAVIFWFIFSIPSVIGDLTGRTARKSIAKIRESNEKAKSTMYERVKPDTSKTSENSDETALLIPIAEETSLLTSELDETILLSENSSEYVVLEEIMFIHTEEIIE